MDGFDIELCRKLNSGKFNISKIVRDTDISRYWIKLVKNNVCVPKYVIVTLNDYFKKDIIDINIDGKTVNLTSDEAFKKFSKMSK